MKAGSYPAWQLLPGDVVRGGVVADCTGNGCTTVLITLESGQAYALPRDMKVVTL